MSPLCSDAERPRRTLLVGNLDCEEEWAALLAATPGARPRPPRTLSAPARAAAAGAATLLRALGPARDGAEAGDGHRLWTLAEVERERIAAVHGLPEVEPVAGPREDLEPEDGVLAWGETPSVARLRRRSGGGPGAPDPDLREGRLPEWPDRLRRLPPADPEVAARVNHRSFSLDLARELERALPGARMVQSHRELVEHLEGAARREVSGGAWLARAPLSAAGRDRVSGEDAEAARRPEVRRRLEGLLVRQGELLVEPLLERTADFGCSGLVEAAPAAERGGPEGAEPAVTLAGIHRLEVDRGGRFTGLILPPERPARSPAASGFSRCHPFGGAGSEAPPAAPGMRGEEREILVATALATGRALAAAGYTGPFGVDAFRWQAPDGGERFHPLSEINARWTFGWIGLVLRERLRAVGGTGADEQLALRFGRTLPEPPEGRGGRRVVPLLLPGGGGASWLELGPASGD